MAELIPGQYSFEHRAIARQCAAPRTSWSRPAGGPWAGTEACPVVFIPGRADQAYCSPACRQRAARARRGRSANT